MEIFKNYLVLDEDLAENPQITITAFGGNRKPVDFSALPSGFAEFYQALNSMKFEWETKEPMDKGAKIYGSLNILLPKDILGDWKDVVYFEDTGANNLIRNFRPVDFYSPEKCVGYFDHGADTSDVMYLLTLGGSEVEPLGINFAQYIELLFMSRGFLHWPYVLLGLQGKDDWGVTEKFKKHMPELFPAFKWEEFVGLYRKMEFQPFLNAYPVSGQPVPYSGEETDRLKGKVPEDLLNFFITMGRCSFADGFFTTVYPYDLDYQSIFKSWGLKKKGECFVFLKTCFGLLFFYLDGKYYFLDAPTGTYERFSNRANMAINDVIPSWSMINEISNYPVYMRNRESLPALKSDEIYMLVPALPLGGSFESSKLEPGKLFEHLCILADLYDNCAEER